MDEHMLFKRKEKIILMYCKWAFPRNNRCEVCGKKFHKYRNTGNESDCSIRHKTTCMGIRAGKCPFCGLKDKEKWLTWVIENKTNIFDESDYKIIHFAPEKILGNKLMQHNKMGYISADIVPGVAMETIDMTSIDGIEDCTYDYLVASMVIEHIEEEEKALRECIRILKKNGKAILSMPIAIDLAETYETDMANTDEKRRFYYGQEDHVRLYGQDVIYRWTSMLNGLDIEIEKISPKSEIGEKKAKAMGIDSEYAIWILTKK